MIDLNAFYSENKWLLLCLAIAIVMVVFYAFFRYVYSHPKWVDDTDDDLRDYPYHKPGGWPGPPAPLQQKNITHDDDYFIQKMYNEKFSIVASIRDAVSVAQLQQISNQIVAFHNYYVLLVDRDTVKLHTQYIYESHARRLAEVQKVAGLFETSS